MVKAVFFDFGGTLMSTESDRKAHWKLMKAVKRRYNLRAPIKELVEKYEYCTHTYPNPLKYEQSHGLKNINNAFSQILKEENKIPDYDWFWKEYLKAHLKNVRLNKRARVILRNIKAKKLHLGLISDVDNAYLHEQLKALKILKFFDSITTSEEVGVRKPSKKIFKIALKKAKCEPRNALYIGDSIERDILGARAVGMIPILFSSNLSSSSLKSPIIKINSLLELRNIVSVQTCKFHGLKPF
ncbi:MAG: HAD-IA family hydrolase [Candidatus Thermoplasmatota archaeon]|nr:HAD-IA family hydrolase [Candidatus Thermoplasmatota archaeon]